MGLETQQTSGKTPGSTGGQTSGSTAGHHDSNLGLCSGYGQGIFVEKELQSTYCEWPHQGAGYIRPLYAYRSGAWG